MSIIVGFVPTPAGEAALTAGIAEATPPERGPGDRQLGPRRRPGGQVRGHRRTSWTTPPAGQRSRRQRRR